MNRTVELLRLVDASGSIDGRKKLQKMVHILREAGYPFGFRFGLHFHGPFSPEVKADIESLASEGLIEEVEGRTPSGEFPQFSYKTTEAGKSVLREIGDDEPAWAILAQKLNAKSAQELEAISTIVYLRRSGVDDASLPDRFKQLKPQLTAQFEPATRFIDTSLKVS